MSELLKIYRERAGDPAFWAEPVNALTNVSFLIAAGLALELALRRGVATPATLLLIVLAASIGVGSFLFHTAAGPVTVWLDIVPIALFQVVFLWLAGREMAGLGTLVTGLLVAIVVGLSFALMPVHQPLNGSLSYLPPWFAVTVLATVVAARGEGEHSTLLLGAGCFTLAIVARSIDWVVPWRIGSHFLWHLLNGATVYFALRAWILDIALRRSMDPS